MGREVRRVALDFNWPLNKPWEGFQNPYYEYNHKCTKCDQSGFSPIGKFMHEQWYGKVPFDPVENGCEPYTAEHPYVRGYATRSVEHDPTYYINKYQTKDQAIECEAERLADLFNSQWSEHLSQQDVDDLIAEDASELWHLTRKPRTPEQEEQLKKQAENGGNPYWLDEPNGYTPTLAEVVDINRGMGGGRCSHGYIIAARCKRIGVPHLCSVCHGNGNVWETPEYQELAEEWKKIEPPAGDGWQLWETVSEGSPVTPVFATPEELARHLSIYQSGGHSMSYEKWLKFIVGPGWAPSAMMIGGKYISGSEAVVILEEAK